MPTDKNQIVHTDIYTNTGKKFITFIDKFCKFATVYPIEHSNHTEIIEKFCIYFNHKKPQKIIADNGFKDINIKDFVREENIEIHLAKPHSHTGNSDIERLHNTLTEKIGILNLENPVSINIQALKAIRYYNTLFHSTTKYSPNECETNPTLKDKIYENLIKTQTKRLEQQNSSREKTT